MGPTLKPLIAQWRPDPGDADFAQHIKDSHSCDILLGQFKFQCQVLGYLGYLGADSRLVSAGIWSRPKNRATRPWCARTAETFDELRTEHCTQGNATVRQSVDGG